MRAPAALVCGALLLFGGAAGARAQSGDQVSANTCCRTLLVPIGARTVALGGAIVARSHASSLFANPAAVAAAADQFVVHAVTTPAYRMNAFALLIRSEIIGTIGVTYHLFDVGDFEARDAQGNVTGTIRALDHALTATYATRVAAGLSAGLTYQLFQSRTDCSGFCNNESSSATTHLVDAGLVYQPAFADSLELGLSLLHLGFPLQVRNAQQAGPTPAQLRTGAALEVLRFVHPEQPIALWLSGDVVLPLRNPDEATVHVGAEASFAERFFLWLGYAAAPGLQGGAGIGVGIEIDRFSLGVAKPFVSSSFGGIESFPVSFAVRF
jgi:hypothetical protein